MRKDKVFEDVEVHDMSEMDSRSGHRNKGVEKEGQVLTVVDGTPR